MTQDVHKTKWRKLKRFLSWSVGIVVLLGVSSLVGVRLWLSEARLTQLVNRQINDYFAGHFVLGSVRWDLPLSVEAQNIAITPPDGTFALRVSSVRATVALPPLLRGKVVVSAVDVESPVVRLVQASDDTSFTLLSAFAPRHPAASRQPDGPEPASGTPLPLRVEHINVHRGHLVLRMPGIRASAKELTLEDGTLWLAGTQVGIDLHLQTDLRLGQGDKWIKIPNLRLSAANLVLQVGPDALGVEAPDLQVQAPGLNLLLSGKIQQPHDAPPTATARLEIETNDTLATLPGLLTAEQRRQCHGGLKMVANLEATAEKQTIRAEATGDNLMVGEVDFKSLSLLATYKKPELTVSKLDVSFSGSQIEAQGSAMVQPDARTQLGVHTLQVHLNKLPLRRLLRMWVKDADSIPELLSADLRGQGKSLWPLASLMQVKVTARGIPAAKLPGIPDPLEMQGTVMARPDVVELNPLKFRGDDAELSLQGSVPLNADGVVNLFTHLIHAGPNSTFKRLKTPLGARFIELRGKLWGRLANPNAEGLVQVADLHLEKGGNVQLTLPFDLHNGKFSLARGHLDAPHGKVRMDASVALRSHGRWAQQPAMEGRVDFQKVQLNEFLPELRGLLTGSAKIHGTLQEPRGRAEFQTHGLRYAEAQVSQALLTVNADGTGINVERLRLRPKEGGAVEAHGRVTWATHGIAADMQIQALPLRWASQVGRLKQLLGGTVDANFKARGTWDEPLVTANANFSRVTLPEAAADLEVNSSLDINATLAKVETRLTSLSLRNGQHALELRSPGYLILQDNALRVESLQLEGSAGSIRLSGTLDDLSGVPKARQVSADGSVDMKLVAAMVPALSYANGTLGVHASVDGKIEALRVHGSLHVVKPLVARLRGGGIAEVRVDRADVEMTPQLLRLHSLTGSLGGGAFAAKGEVVLANMLPHAYRIHLQGNDLPLRTPELLLEANVNLDLLGEGTLPQVKGRVDITRGRYNKALALKDYYFVATAPADTSTPLAERAPFLGRLRLDVTATTADDVAVKIDAGALAVQTDLRANLHITGNALRPRIDGKISSERGTLHFPKADLEIQRAAIDFEPNKQGRLEAQIALQAEGEVTPSNSNGAAPVLVDMSLEGSLDKMALDLQASPAKSRLDILTLLVTGYDSLSDMAQGNGDDTTKVNAALAFAGSQASEPLARLAQEQLEKSLNLKLELSATVSDQNVTVTAGKRITPRLRIAGSYQRGISDSTAAVGSRAQLAITDRLLLEGSAVHDLSSGSSNPADSMEQSSIQLKWRLLGL